MADPTCNCHGDWMGEHTSDCPASPNHERWLLEQAAREERRTAGLPRCGTCGKAVEWRSVEFTDEVSFGATGFVVPARTFNQPCGHPFIAAVQDLGATDAG